MALHLGLLDNVVALLHVPYLYSLLGQFFLTQAVGGESTLPWAWIGQLCVCVC